MSRDIMSTLSDVTYREDGYNLPGADRHSCTAPQAIDATAGVSVRCAPAATEEWYVIRVTYGRWQKALAHITSLGIKTYVPLTQCRSADPEAPFRMRVTTMPLVPNIIFARTEPQVVTSLLRGRNSLNCITPYYDHFKTDRQGRNEYLTVPDRQMENFIRLTSVNDRHVRVVALDECRFKSGDTVIVTNGKFKGIMGRVARVGGQQRVVVTLDGVCSIATAYIPTAFLAVCRPEGEDDGTYNNT